ncbi:MAG TPA: hypothetical protein VGN82_01015 [Bosea sp. (in: a-proteobacteria)]|nr:hypothetical protein [Bosea sp. (in: a-proteobacteria)]
MAATASPEQITPAGVILALPCKVMCFPRRNSKADLISSGWDGREVGGSSATTDMRHSGRTTATIA